MAESIVERTVHERHVFRRFSCTELEALVADVVLREAQIGSHVGLKVKVSFEDETQGSPAYKVGTKAVVEVVQDLAQVHTAPGLESR
ncbi:MAG: hypothetical protein ACYDD1_11375 [Caulobacteraceae bacterium]